MTCAKSKRILDQGCKALAEKIAKTTNHDDPIVRSIIQLAHALDMQVVAEWVSSPDQLRRLRVLGCDMVQGHLLGEPVDASHFASRASR